MGGCGMSKLTEEEKILKSIFGTPRRRKKNPNETKCGKDKQLENYLTVGKLREVIAKLPDDAPVFIERIEDVYFDPGKGWQENSAFKDVEGDGHLSQFIQAYWPIVFKKDEAVYLTPHY
jgi:hypothetical protein